MVTLDRDTEIPCWPVQMETRRALVGEGSQLRSRWKDSPQEMLSEGQKRQGSRPGGHAEEPQLCPWRERPWEALVSTRLPGEMGAVGLISVALKG